MLDIGHGFAAVDVSGTLQGVALWWGFGADFATLGLVIVSPVLQRSGIGNRLLGAIMEAAGGRQVQLNATDKGLRLYQRFGFVETGGITQHQGTLSPEARPLIREGITIRPAQPGDRPAIVALDRRATGIDRSAVLATLSPLSMAYLAKRGGDIVGSLLCRAFGRGRLLGPLIAVDEAVAVALASSVACETRGFLRADIPDGATALADWLDGVGLGPAGHVITMRTSGPDRSSPDARVFALASQAWG